MLDLSKLRAIINSSDIAKDLFLHTKPQMLKNISIVAAEQCALFKISAS
jgi:hypothetical protein